MPDIKKYWSEFLRPGRIPTLIFFFSPDDTEKFGEIKTQMDFNIEMTGFAVLAWGKREKK